MVDTEIMEKLKRIINNRVVCILAHGKSIEQLEQNIEQFKDLDICWASVGLFTIMEDFILSKINKHLDIVFDCASVSESNMNYYENEVRLPRLEKFLSRNENNLWITTHGIIRDILKGLNKTDFLDKFRNKIFVVDSLFPTNTSHYMSVPNSITLLIASAIAGGAKRIILFGFDGYKGDPEKGIDSYYKSEFHIQERLKALGSVIDEGINRDTINFENNFIKIWTEYVFLFKREGKLGIVNCSPNSCYSVIPKTDYEEVIRWVKA